MTGVRTERKQGAGGTRGQDARVTADGVVGTTVPPEDGAPKDGPRNRLRRRDDDFRHTSRLNLNERVYALQDANFNVTALVTHFTLVGDITGDGRDNSLDLAVMMSNYNKHVAGGDAVGDLDHNGMVNSLDLPKLLANYNHTTSNNQWLVTERLVYNAYGAFTTTVRDAVGVWHNWGDYLAWNITFQGGRWNALTRQVQFGVRQVDVDTGRWTSAEPSLGAYVDGLNLYQAFAANPINYTDPSGLKIVWDPGPLGGFPNRDWQTRLEAADKKVSQALHRVQAELSKFDYKWVRSTRKLTIPMPLADYPNPIELSAPPTVQNLIVYDEAQQLLLRNINAMIDVQDRVGIHAKYHCISGTGWYDFFQLWISGHPIARTAGGARDGVIEFFDSFYLGKDDADTFIHELSHNVAGTLDSGWNAAEKFKGGYIGNQDSALGAVTDAVYYEPFVKGFKTETILKTTLVDKLFPP